MRDANNPLAEYIDGFDEFEYLCRGHAIVHNVAINNDLLEKSSKKDQFLLLGVVRSVVFLYTPLVCLLSSLLLI